MQDTFGNMYTTWDKWIYKCTPDGRYFRAEIPEMMDWEELGSIQLKTPTKGEIT